MKVSAEAAAVAVRAYKEHRATYDARDWEIERIYRAIAKGQTVISVNDAIRCAGLDDKCRPKLPVCRADALQVRCVFSSGTTRFEDAGWGRRWTVEVTGLPATTYQNLSAHVPRIPPQHRPARKYLSKYHILWEANWIEIPRDPYLLKRIGKDAWIVLAAWDLTDVEVSVLRAHTGAAH
jgi:hypothetical protein